MSESAVSVKRGWVSFGAKPAQSETPVRAAVKRRPLGGGRSGRKDAKLPEAVVGEDCYMTEVTIARSSDALRMPPGGNGKWQIRRISFLRTAPA